ncbi:hypothetical protein PR202_gb22752 [Eleusine coracana subsp. coracana]|uniref:Cytochrome P450 n=1 Tax=Eleusine coracana subsp. coracana TaxID=191504 RepID=A0AAV5FIN1_ELECO|nr:hypothetical protein QOZ80_6AG0534020 [Eleusine coracana subsp. coracana]GJN34111.1 hypothetical protein PR202_gb22752 [Eleusine coracana subsp. coracana]
MESVQLLTLGLAIFIFIVVFRRRTAYARPVPTLPRVVVRDPEVVRRILFDHADAFSDRGVSSFPVDFNGTRLQKRYSMNTVPFGPRWRSFRCNLTSNIFHPSRLGWLGHFQREAVKALVADLSAQCPAGEVTVRDSLHRAIFPLLVRLCFGDGVDMHVVHAIRSTLQEFFDGINPARALAPSMLGRLVHWRQWLRFAGTFERLNALFGPLIEERRRRSKCGGFHSYVDSLLEL